MHGMRLTSALRELVRKRVATRLNKFASAIQRVTVRIEDINGPRGGLDKACRAKVLLRGVGSVLAVHQHNNVRTAIAGALRRAESGVRRSLARRKTKPSRVSRTARYRGAARR
jgi:ribosome-associated translation inhibitor RaiA